MDFGESSERAAAASAWLLERISSQVARDQTFVIRVNSQGQVDEVVPLDQLGKAPRRGGDLSALYKQTFDLWLRSELPEGHLARSAESFKVAFLNAKSRSHIWGRSLRRYSPSDHLWFSDPDVSLSERSAEEGASAIARDADAIPDYEARREALLDRAAKAEAPRVDPVTEFFDVVRSDAAMLLGGAEVIGRTIASEDDVVEAVSAGLPAGVIKTLRDKRVPPFFLEEVVAPKRTLMRRKAEGARLTPAESDSAWRLATTIALAARVFDGPKAAYEWLARAKSVFNGRTPIELLKTSVGTALVQQVLNQLEWGEVA